MKLVPHSHNLCSLKITLDDFSLYFSFSLSAPSRFPLSLIVLLPGSTTPSGLHRRVGLSACLLLPGHLHASDSRAQMRGRRSSNEEADHSPSPPYGAPPTPSEGPPSLGGPRIHTQGALPCLGQSVARSAAQEEEAVSTPQVAYPKAEPRGPPSSRRGPPPPLSLTVGPSSSTSSRKATLPSFLSSLRRLHPRRLGLPLHARVFRGDAAHQQQQRSNSNRVSSAEDSGSSCHSPRAQELSEVASPLAARAPREKALRGPRPEPPSRSLTAATGDGEGGSGLVLQRVSSSLQTAAATEATATAAGRDSGRDVPLGEAGSPLESRPLLFEPLWFFSQETQLVRDYLHAQEAALMQPGSESRCSAKAYLRSLYKYGWALCPVRFDSGWFKAATPSLLSGLFIPFSLVPTAMTCALISGLPVSAALNSCWLLSLTTTILGGAPGTVSSVTEAMSTALVTTVYEDCSSGTECTYTGREFIYPAGILSGLLQFLCGLWGLGRFMTLVSPASRVGYTNAVAIINCRAQLHAFKFDPVTSTGYEWLWVLGLILEVCFVMHAWQHAAPCGLSNYLPASAVALGASVFTEFFIVRKIFRMKTKTVGDVSSLAGGSNLPRWFFLSPAFAPPTEQLLSVKGIYKLLEVSLTLVLLSSMATGMTLEKLQETSSWKFEKDRQLAAIGIANGVSCLLGCLPGATGMMTSLLAARMGARSKEGPLLASVCLCVFTSVAYHALDAIPLGGLSGAIVYTAINAVSWRSLPRLAAAFLPESLSRKYKCMQPRWSRTEASVVLVTTVLGATANLGSALLIGIFVSLGSHAWRSIKQFRVASGTNTEGDMRIHLVEGPLFYGCTRKLERHLDASLAPQRSIVVMHAASAAPEHAVVRSLANIAQGYAAADKEIEFCAVRPRGEALAPLIGLQLKSQIEKDRGQGC
ncbi:hypothetical protein Emag_004246 [Eimeria magna]